MQKARQIAAQHGAKFIPVHHMEAHALIARAGTAVQFPYLCLLVSGGHNMVVVVEGVGSYTLLGSTLDDAVGEDASLLDSGPLDSNRNQCGTATSSGLSQSALSTACARCWLSQDS